MLEISEKLKNKKLKVTPQRIAIYSILYNDNIHPSAEYIYKLLKKSHPTISLSTVYKTISTFTKSGLIREINIGEDSFRYEVISNPHPHFICNKCKTIYDLPIIDSIYSLKNEFNLITNFKILTEQMYFYGICHLCKE